MFEFIEKIVYINLEHRTDRKREVESELRKYFPVEKIQRFNAIQHHHGGIGCTMSHIAVLEIAIENNWKNCLIIEDDAVWSNFPTSYPILEKLVNNSFDVITLGIAHAKYTPEFKLLSGQTTTAYLVEQNYYTIMLGNFKEGLGQFLKTGNYCTYALDQYWKKLQAKDNWYCVIPSLVVQKPSFSDIERKNTDYIKYFS